MLRAQETFIFLNIYLCLPLLLALVLPQITWFSSHREESCILFETIYLSVIFFLLLRQDQNNFQKRGKTNLTSSSLKTVEDGYVNLIISLRPQQIPLFHCHLEMMTMYKEVLDLMRRDIIQVSISSPLFHLGRSVQLNLFQLSEYYILFI